MSTNLTIYKDKDTEVQIDKNFHNRLYNYRPVFFTLNKPDFEVLLDKAALILKLQYYKDNNKISNTEQRFIGNILIVQSGKIIKLVEPYDIFNPILEYLGTFLTLDNVEEEIMTDINSKFSSKGFYCHIFSHSFFDVKGFISYIDDNNTERVLFFSFKDDLQMLDFLDFF